MNILALGDVVGTKSVDHLRESLWKIREKYKANMSDIFTVEYSEFDFVQSYNKLYNDYSSTLDYVFSCKNLEKQQMAEGVSLSKVVEEAQIHVINILNVLGF